MMLERAVQYAKECISGKEITTPEVIKQCEWFLRDLKRQQEKEFAYCMDTDFLGLVEGIFGLLHFATGLGIVGDTIYDGLQNHQWFLFCNIFGWRLKQDRRRYRYREVVFFIARKNAKTFDAALILIILMLTEDDHSEFYSICVDRDLAGEVKKAIRQILEASPDVMGCDGKKRFLIPKTLTGKVECMVTHSFYQPRTAMATSNNAIRPAAFIADEVGAFTDNSNIEAMHSGQLSVRNPIMFKLTTAYAEDNSIMLDELEYLKKIFSGTEEDERLFALLYYAPEEHLWDDIGLYMANPLRVEMNYEEIRDRRRKALAKPAEREEYLTKHMNHFVPTNAGEGFVDVEKVKLCRAERALDWRGRKVYVGLDLSQTNDNTAVVMATEVDGVVYVKAWGFIPADRVGEKSRRERVNYQRLIEEGACFACGSEVIDYGYIEQFIMQLPETYGVGIEKIGYDRYNCISTAQKLEGAGFMTVEVKQHSSVLHPATKWLLETILKRLLCYESNRMLEQNFQNARCTRDTNQNMYVNKKKSKGKVDLVVATIIAMHLLLDEKLYGMGDFVCQEG